MRDLVDALNVPFNKVPTTPGGIHTWNQLRYKQRSLLGFVKTCQDEISALPSKTVLSSDQQMKFGLYLVNFIREFSWIVTVVCEACCPIDRHGADFQSTGIKRFIECYKKLTKNKSGHLKQLNQLRTSYAHASGSYSDHPDNCTHYSKCSVCKTYVPLLETCRAAHDGLDWTLPNLCKFLGNRPILLLQLR